MKIIHIINSLKKGGAEGNLYRLCEFHKKKYNNKIDITIITLIDNGFYEFELNKIGVNIFSLDLSSRYNLINFVKKILQFRKYIKDQNPDIIQSWMYHSNFITIFIHKIFYNKIFWNIRHSELNFSISKKTTIMISIICGVISKIIPKKIIYCSERSKNFHENIHLYNKKKSKLIDNGFSEINYFSSKNMREKFREMNKINDSDITFGFAGRYAKQKNIPSLLNAFSIITKTYSNLSLCMAGKNINKDNKELKNLIEYYKIQDKVKLLNEKKNLVEFYNGIDLLILTSHSESFPNVVAESMLCSTPVLSSDAGCAKKIIDNYGFIFNDNKQEVLIQELKKIINLFINNKSEWQSLKKKSRLHIKNNFSISNMADSYLKNWIFK